VPGLSGTQEKIKTKGQNMAKLIKKSKCSFEAGHIIKKGEVVGIPQVVWMQLNKLEVIYQQYCYLKKQPAYQPGPSLDDFKRQSSLTSDRPYVETPETPVTDKRVAEAMAFMEETDKTCNACKVNEVIDEYGDLIDWLNADKFIEGNCYSAIDTPFLGNPLELDDASVVKIISMIIESPIVMAIPVEE